MGQVPQSQRQAKGTHSINGGPIEKGNAVLHLSYMTMAHGSQRLDNATGRDHQTQYST